MAKLKPLQTSFVKGEVSDRVQGQVDKPFYAQALKECQNFEPTPQGSILMRGGTELVLPAASENVRLIEMRTRRFGAFILELTPLQLRIYDATTKALQTNAPDLAVGGQFDSVLTGWLEGVQSSAADPYLISPGNWGCRLQRPAADPKTAYLRNKDPFGIAAATDYVLSFDFVKRNQGNARIGVRLGTTEFGAELGTYYFDQPGICTLPFNSAGAVALEVYFFLDPLDGTAYDDVVFDNVQLRVAAGATVIVTPWSLEHLDELQFALEPATDKAYFFHSSTAPQRLIRNGDGTWTLGPLSAVAGAALPIEWAGTNWPSVCAIGQGRLWAGATPAEGHRLWGSQSGSPHIFSLGTGLANEGIDIKLSTQGSLRWLKYGRGLLAGTELGEHSVSSSTGLLKPNDVHIRDESAFGAAKIQAVHAGPFALFISHDLRKVRAALYDQQSNGIGSKDVTFLAEHITAPALAELHYARAPFGSIVGRLADGSLALCTFDPNEDIAGWWKLVTAGEVRSVAVGDTGGSTYLWLAVKRTNGTYIERMRWTDVVARLDSYISRTIAVGQTVITGLGHLEGETVRIVFDGALEPDQVVIGEQVTLGRVLDHASTVYVGLPFTARAKTLPPPDHLLGKARIAKATLLLNDSALPLLNGDRAEPDRTPATPMDTAEPQRTKRVRVSVLGWDDDGALAIEQDLPFRTEILGIFSSGAANEV